MKPAATWLAQIHAICFSNPRPWDVAEFETILQSEGATLVARPKGFVLARAVLDEAEILTIAVLPAARKRGVGRDLMGELAQKLTAKGVGYLFLEVAESNSAALALYYSLGFVESGKRTGYYANSAGDRQDALILSKRLT
ncbi:MAG: ribosomal protein S18-alanine N-acetyltransferase [Paracoccaceae bacterium]